MAARIDLSLILSEAREDLDLSDMPTPGRPLPTGIRLEAREIWERRVLAQDLLTRLTGP
ncbi:hypothetical protein ACE7GA_09410 [Roseomonas sp. CCTCC AB2023176]|uniref:hypothetical protein n=1 Tax=Roseomonas sp. CCTCC AB2023176 TaxID=3342640 RepID=UPI0035DA3927